MVQWRLAGETPAVSVASARKPGQNNFPTSKDNPDSQSAIDFRSSEPHR